MHAAWLAIAAIAHNLLRAVGTLLSDPMDARGMFDGKALHRLGQDPVALL